MLRPALLAHFNEYADCHRHPVNRLTHQIALPLIVFHVLAMLSWVVLGVPFGVPFTLGHLVAAAALVYYAALDRRLALVMAPLVALCFPLAAVAPRGLVLGLALVGWTIQLAGHIVWEKRSPAFFTNLVQALIGPLYFVAVLVGLWPDERARTLDLGGPRVG